MIKFKYYYPHGFIERFKNDFIIVKVISKANEVYEELVINAPLEALSYKGFLSKNSILGFIFCKGKDLKKKIDEVYGNYPLIADRFCPAWVFNKYNFRFDLLNLDLSIDDNKAIILGYKPELRTELQKIIDDNGSILATELVLKLDDLHTAKSISKLFSRIRYICLGRSRLTNRIEDKYPLWFKEISKIFNYDKLRAEYGVEIISSTNLAACPYCNARKIEVVKGLFAVGTPDLDHFYPKSRYPFLATTLSNFIPSCWYCNQKFKREKDTYQGYLHPLLKGTEKYNVFKFTPTLDSQPKILLHGCNQFKQNISMFELEKVYESDSYKQKYKRINDLIDYHKELRGNMNAVTDDKFFFELTFDMGDNLSTQNTIDHKFKLDVLSHLTHNNYRR